MMHAEIICLRRLRDTMQTEIKQLQDECKTAKANEKIALERLQNIVYLRCLRDTMQIEIKQLQDECKTAKANEKIALERLRDEQLKTQTLFSRCPKCQAIIDIQPGNDRLCDSCE